MRKYQTTTKHKITSLIMMFVFYFLFVFGAAKLLQWGLSYLSRFGVSMPLNGIVYYPIVGVIIVVLVHIFWHRLRFKDMGIQKVKMKDWKYALYIFAGLFLVAFISRIIDPGFDAWYTGLNNLAGLSAFIALVFVMSFQVIHEEIFQRCLLQSTCSKVTSPLYTAIVISAGFAIAHFFFVPDSLYHIIINMVFVFLGSILLVTLFEKTRNIFLSLIVHFVYNVVVIFQIYFHVSNILLWEIVLFAAWGVLFVFFAKRIYLLLKNVLFAHVRRPDLLGWVFIALAGFVFPILMYVVFLS